MNSSGLNQQPKIYNLNERFIHGEAFNLFLQVKFEEILQSFTISLSDPPSNFPTFESFKNTCLNRPSNLLRKFGIEVVDDQNRVNMEVKLIMALFESMKLVKDLGLVLEYGLSSMYKKSHILALDKYEFPTPSAINGAINFGLPLTEGFVEEVKRIAANNSLNRLLSLGRNNNTSPLAFDFFIEPGGKNTRMGIIPLANKLGFHAGKNEAEQAQINKQLLLALRVSKIRFINTLLISYNGYKQNRSHQNLYLMLKITFESLMNFNFGCTRLEINYDSITSAEKTIMRITSEVLPVQVKKVEEILNKFKWAYAINELNLIFRLPNGNHDNHKFMDDFFSIKGLFELYNNAINDDFLLSLEIKLEEIFTHFSYISSEEKAVYLTHFIQAIEPIEKELKKIELANNNVSQELKIRIINLINKIKAFQ